MLFTLESDISLSTKRAVGSVMELRLDRGDPNLCIVSVSSDNSPWVDAYFRATEEVLSESKNRNAWIRNNWTALVIQFLGVVIGFFFSLWGGTKIAPYLSIENAFLISFFLALLLFSNLWVYLNKLLHVWLNREFPNIKFYRPDRDKKHWLTRSIIVTIVGAIILYVASWVFLYVGRIVGGFISETPDVKYSLRPDPKIPPSSAWVNSTPTLAAPRSRCLQERSDRAAAPCRPPACR